MKKVLLAVSASVGVPLLIFWSGCSSGGSSPTRGPANQGAGGNAGSAAGAGGFGGTILIPPAGPDGSIGSAGAGTSPGPMPVMIDRTRGILPNETVDALLKGSSGGLGAMAFLYPYDKTVFPGGILAPLLQWNPAPGPIAGIYVHIRSKTFDYKEVFPGTTLARLELPRDAWDAAAQQSQGATDPTSVELTTISGTTVSGPITEQWIFARGQLKNAVYYNTYGSSKTVSKNGAVMRILPLAKEPEVVKTVASGSVPLGPCYSCHSLSSNGQMLVAQRHQYPLGPYSSNSFDVAATATPDPPPLAASSVGNEDWGFSAVYPDGSKLLTAAQPATASGFPFPAASLNNPGMLGPRQAKLFDTRTGAAIPSSGLVAFAKMPSFSPDGKKVAFNDHDAGQGRSLSIMDFANAANAFSNRVEIFRDPMLYPGWPFFTPDALELVFALGSGTDYATIEDPPTGLVVNRSNLYIVDVGTRQARSLDLANGRNLPMRDQNLNYYPTVSPVASGGYFWVFFTSRRTYGNVMTQAETDPVTKKLWVSAIDIEAMSGASAAPMGDPSHPAFYLPGQELEAGNIRAFATLTPCTADGGRCTSGIDCCGGFCVNGLCKPSTPECSKVDDKCSKDGDCCLAAPPLLCLGGYCATSPIVR
jgi:hypothetical protein